MFEMEVKDIAIDTIPVADLQNDPSAKRWLVEQIEEYLTGPSMFRFGIDMFLNVLEVRVKEGCTIISFVFQHRLDKSGCMDFVHLLKQLCMRSSTISTNRMKALVLPTPEG